MEFPDSLPRFVWQLFVIWLAIFMITGIVTAMLDALKLAAFNLGWVVFISFLLLILEVAAEILLESKARRRQHEHQEEDRGVS
jgi:hypothetical protein